MKTITIECDRCTAPAGSCDDCVVRVMLDGGRAPTLTADEQAAVAALAAGNLLPPLRLVTPDDAAWRAVA